MTGRGFLVGRSMEEMFLGEKEHVDISALQVLHLKGNAREPSSGELNCCNLLNKIFITEHYLAQYILKKI